MVKRGVSRQLGSPPRQKLPITVCILKKLYQTMDFNDNADVAFWAAILLGFYGLLRKSTLLLMSAKTDVNEGLLRKDVTVMTKQGFFLIVRKSKTIQFGQHVLSLPFVTCKDPELCPVRAMLNHLNAARFPACDSLFSYMGQGRSALLTHSSFVKRMRNGLIAVGISPGEYSGHSLRRGGCTLCFAAGMSIVDIKL
jgi:hypothetical protein